MLRFSRLACALIIVCTVFQTVFQPALESADAADPTLQKYVNRQDDNYQWTERRRGEIGATEYVELTLTSQKWQDVVWQHQLFVIRPKNIDKKSQQAVLVIGGGAWSASRAAKDNPEAIPSAAKSFAFAAEQLQTTVAVLLQVPHQPIFDGKYEDAAIAHTFSEFLKGGTSDWPLLLPMTKSAVKAMDAVQEFSSKEWNLKIKGFTVTGASKRGWTTWLTGAVDPRVTGIAPMVIDMLNMEAHLEHQKKSWGKLSRMIDDYTEQGLDKHLGTPRGKQLQQIVDPFNYREQLKQPKLIIIGTNDDYWPLDSLNIYWNELLGPKYILYVPNNRHGLTDFPRLIGSIKAFNDSVGQNKTLPKLTWNFDHNGEASTMSVTSDIAPQKVRAWITTSKT
ncbi:MAG: PhoPQ-activated pathogenicity-related protein, partial [Pirellulaceae bacterium]